MKWLKRLIKEEINELWQTQLVQSAQDQQMAHSPQITMDIPIETLSSLSGSERQALVRLTFDDGFPVLIKVLNAICYEATCRLMTCAPENKEQVAALHTEARCKHEFTTRMIGIIRHLNSLQIPKANPEGEEDVRRTAGIYSNSRSN